MNDQQLLRYSRQILLPQIDLKGQQKLLNARVLIIGLGGLGSPAAIYLASAGVGELLLSDDDKVDLSNLQRQIVHSEIDIGTPKTASAKETLMGLNKEVKITELPRRLEGAELEGVVEEVDLVLDCCDNFTTRFAVNRACVKSETPLVSGAAIRFEGQLAVYTPGRDNSPCYNCLYAEIDELAESCSQNGVIAPITGIIGSMQALEAIKLITGIGKPLVGRLLLLDALTMEWQQMALPRNTTCPTCS